MYRWVTGDFGRQVHLGKIFNFILKDFFWKVVFLQINLALATQNCNKINFRGQKRAKTNFFKSKNLKKWGFRGKGGFSGGRRSWGCMGSWGEVKIYFYAKFEASSLKTDWVMLDVRINQPLGPLQRWPKSPPYFFRDAILGNHIFSGMHIFG